MNSQHWHNANHTLCAKIISELHYEERLHPKQIQGFWQLTTLSRNWTFNANVTIWGMLDIDLTSLKCSDGKLPQACQLLLDVRDQLSISDINLGNLLEEIQQTLYSDVQRLSNLSHITAQDLVNMNETQRQQYIDAHPKAIANKGRLGWGKESLQNYSPESGAPFKLRWLAARKSHCLAGITEQRPYEQILTNILGDKSLSKLSSLLGDQLQDFWLFAVHPWQHQRFLTAQYACLFAQGDLIDLGEHGPDWHAQQSIRTLSTLDNNVSFDAKTALSILNTSCYRGIPGKFIVQGPRLSAWLNQIAKSDTTLRDHGLHVQQEVAGFYCPHPYQAQIKQGPYRYHEMLGCIWRERAETVIGPLKRPITMAALMQTDLSGQPLIGALIENSELDIEHWLEKLFNHVVIPIYHLMCQYGVGLVAHGQNVTLILENNQPVGCIIKDFHGDLRLVDQDYPELDSLDLDIRKTLTRLPAHYLVHDLLTGHFVTVLRFISPKVASLGLSEVRFYRLLNQVITQYQTQHPELTPRYKQFDLLSPKIDKICINRVRFKIGYGDSDERPLPDVGQPIDNPLMG
ncbi:IucA/IucC family protein [Shewanella sp. VB17]|uniref:IucA/IucC family protein n=1 Tax=Shewanella sp. VB17 TaxID=2739432 RepID=UPI00156795E0|nr:IucA/IucC family protein [Shewanella sp. VB17]NRD75339.1 IucA/IucC family protein [Shewanella sp. VB17]